MPAPVLASALDLVQWADQYEAAALLPELIRRLVLATLHPAPSSLTMRGNEGVRLAGWDGHVVCVNGNAFVPSGESGWEMGVSADITDKATKDYSKRTRTPRPIPRDTSTFVFVTPRRWAGKDSWIARRKKKNAVWQDIRVLDADDLAAWLVTAPGVHLWLSERLGMPATEAQTLEMWWEAWRTLTSHPISPALMGSGREAAAQSLSLIHI